MKSMRERLLSSTMIVGAATLSFVGPFAGHVSAQTVPTAPADQGSPAFGPAAAASIPATNAAGAPASVAEVVVTGSRIRSPSLTSTSPLTVVGSQEIKNIGATGVETLLNQLPSVTPDQGSGLSGLSNGTATIDLRDLNAKRTLVLVDGKRLMPGDPTGLYSLGADVNVIPAALVDRVEVVTGGASAVYGSDAVAGVVNFIMLKNFQGLRLTATDNAAEHDNNDATARGLLSDAGFAEAPSGNQVYNLDEDVNAVLGMNSPDGKGNVTGYAGYRHLEPILEGKYDYSACTISAANVHNSNSLIYDGHVCGGSSNGLYGKFVPVEGGISELDGGTTTTLHDNTDGSKSFVTTNVPRYNYGATNYFQRSETRYTGGYFAHYEFNPKLDVYSDFMFMDDATVGQIAPSGFFGGTGANGTSTFAINCNNPLMTAAQQGQLCGSAAGTALQVPYQIGYRFASFPRDYGYRHTDYKINIGARGQLGEAWSYDAYLQYGTSVLSNLLQNDVSTSHLQNALLVDPATGACFSGGTCVPLNIFQAGGVNQQMFNYVSVPAQQQGQTVEQVASASLTGDLAHYGLKSPFADSGVGVALGTEYRREYLTFTPDVEYTTADLSGTSPTYPTSGSFDVYELFGEVQAPLVHDKPFVHDLTFNGGYRFSDYSLAGTTNAYKIQFEYAPTSDIRFRGGYNRAVRAPNVVELFKPSQVGLFGGSDPCVGSSPSATLAECVATGLPKALYGQLSNDYQCPAGQCGLLQAGNAALKPETADTFTGGFVLTPTMPWARGFTLSVDYFNIKVSNVIQQTPGNVFVNECVSGQLNVCSQYFHRDPSTYVLYGQLGYVVSTATNSGFLRTDGIDVEGNYHRRFTDFGLPDWGDVSLNLIATYTNSYVDQPVSGGGVYNCAGLYGLICGNPLPKIKGKARLTYTPSEIPVSLSAQWRYVGPVHLDNDTSQPLLSATHAYGAIDTADNGLHSFSYLDLTLTWRVRNKITFLVGCNNVLDKDPPIVDSGSYAGSGEAGGNGNSYPGVYDTLGRTLFVTLTGDF